MPIRRVHNSTVFMWAHGMNSGTHPPGVLGSLPVLSLVVLVVSQFVLWGLRGVIGAQQIPFFVSEGIYIQRRVGDQSVVYVVVFDIVFRRCICFTTVSNIYIWSNPLRVVSNPC
eukprot:Tbor_TRINITY_DN5377_c3_g3::TRINITY_DN5377_c3_g3_i2::g.4457::m.4457